MNRKDHKTLSLWKSTLKKLKHNPLAVFSFLILSLYVFAFLLSSMGLMATDFAVTDNLQINQPPSFKHWFGTDFLGRDTLSRAIHGGRVAILVGFFASGISTFIGLSLGAVAGYFSGWVDDFIVWLYSTFDSIPYILLISAFAFALGQGILNLYLALGLTSWVKLCRLTRAEVLKHKEKEYMMAAQALGVSHSKRIVYHLLPNIAHLALIQFSISFVAAIKLEVILSYLGLGVEPGTPSWGYMINDAYSELSAGIWWNFLAAAFFMFFLILSINLLTDALRTALDPKLKLE